MKKLVFREISPGIFESKYIYKSATTGALYEIIVDKNELKYKIRNKTSGRIYCSEKNWTNYAVLIRNLKMHMQKLGVSF